MTFPGHGKYRIVQRGVNAYMIQQRVLWFWIDVLEYDQYTEDGCHQILNVWAADAKVYGRVVWP